MKLREPITLLLISFGVNCFSYGQELRDTLAGAEVVAEKRMSSTADPKLHSFSPGQTIRSIDSVTLERYKMQSVATVLTQQTPVFLRTYGFNGLATLSLRGSSAAQTQVLWDGVPVNNAGLGLADLSLMPVAMVDKLHLVYGSSSSLFGSGNVGGALIMESDPPNFRQALQYGLHLNVGSFGQRSGSVNLSIGTRRLFISGRTILQEARNDFRYTDLSGVSKKMAHAHLAGRGAMVSIAGRLRSGATLKFSGWWQRYSREIPAALFESSSEKLRTDQALRILLRWDHTRKNGRLYALGSFCQEKMDYSDPAVMLSSVSRSQQLYGEGGWNKEWQRSRMIIYVPLQLSWIPTGAGVKSQRRAAIVGSFRYFFRKIKLTSAGSLRAEQLENAFYILPGANFLWRLGPDLQLRANLQRTYRVPSLNELYYQPGGNSSLLPEQGWAQEVGYRYERELSSGFRLVHDVVAYNRQIKDWIYWLGGAIWTPHNIARVRSLGLETENNAIYTFGQKKIYAGVSLNMARSETKESRIPNDGSIGKQVPYAPKLSGLMRLGIEYKDLYVEFQHHYTGVRYITIDESQFLGAYHIQNVQMGYAVRLDGGHHLRFNVQINNLANRHYEVMGFRPMPGINWLLGLGISKL